MGNSKHFSGTAIIILGGTGDLTKRKLIPALNNLYIKGEITNENVIIGVGRTDLDTKKFRDKFDAADAFRSIMYYHQHLSGLKEFIDSLVSVKKYIFFFALPPEIYAETVKSIYKQGFEVNKTTIILEKPFGYNYESAVELNRQINLYFKDENIYRIDHYLAKEPVQNILVFRFANTIFNELMSSKYIESIQINAYEDIGIERRGAYFDKAGIIRDMVQNHLMQLLTLLTMNAPVSLNAEDIRRQKIDILKAIYVKNFSRYQYEGYLNEPGVEKNSKTETYAELELFIDNFRWFNVPINIRAGKALERKGTEIAIVFKQLPNILYNTREQLINNKIIFKIQPSEGIILNLSSKMPGSEMKITNTNMSFCYNSSFNMDIPEAYERLVLDVIKGDKTLFVSAEETELSWKVFENILDSGKLEYYKKGQAPAPKFCDNRVDFENYIQLCSI